MEVIRLQLSSCSMSQQIMKGKCKCKKKKKGTGFWAELRETRWQSCFKNKKGNR